MRKMCLKWTVISVLLSCLLIFLLSGSVYFGVLHQQKLKFPKDIDKALGYGMVAEAQVILSAPDDLGVSNGLLSLINSYSERMDLGSNRKCYILRANDLGILYPSVMQSEYIQITPNLETAMQGRTKGATQNIFGDFLDYAYYFENPNGDGEYIIYVRDDCSEINEVLGDIKIVSLFFLIFGVILSGLLGYIFSRKFVKPIKKLTDRAEAFAEGKFDFSPEGTSRDEMGVLVDTFRHMGSVMQETIKNAQTEKHKLEVILEQVNNGIMAFDTEQNLIHINEVAKKLLNITDKSDITFDDFFSKLDAGVCMAEFLYLEPFKDKEIRDITTEHKHLRLTFVPFKFGNEKIGGVACVFEDFTERFNLEEVRQKFVAEVSHELKTPITIIRTYTETLLNGYINDKNVAPGYLSTILREADNMTGLVSNLLTLSRFDVQKFEMHKEPFSLDEMLRNLVKTFSLEADIEDIDLTYDKVTDIPQIYADKDQIERAIKNIISNAIKYSDQGSTVKIFAGNLYNEVYVKVEDNGQGIKKEDLEHVFERFYRVDKARTREKGGTGLGLSIAKEIIENHGGHINIESEYMKYTRVTISLPMANKA